MSEPGQQQRHGGGGPSKPRAPDPFDESQILAGGGELGAALRDLDWSANPLGPPSTWPQSLKTAVSILLNSRYPMFLFWGPELVKIYNDGYRPITGAKHPWALGKPGPEVWPEIWDTIGPMVERVIVGGEATWSDDLQLFMERNGFPEEVYFTFSYSPIRVELGGIGGMFCACTETTEKVLGARRLETLRDLAARPAEVSNVSDACRLSVEVLANNRADIPFGLVYLFEGDSKRALLAGVAGTEPDEPGSPAVIEPTDEHRWPLSRVADGLRGEVVKGLEQRFGAVPRGPWPDPPHSAMILPLLAQGQERAVGALILGISSRRPFDEAYKDFFELVGKQISTSIAKAKVLEEERRRAEALAELDRAKTAFFSNVSHEFRTPLTLMLGPTEDLLSGAHGELSPGQRVQLEMIRRNELRLQRLVNALLEFSRIEAGRVQAQFERTDLSAFTRDLASSFRSAVERAGLKFVVDCPSLDVEVFVDRSMWEQIVLNLLSNALKFTFEGQIAISLRSEGGSVVLSVEDTGVGVRAEDVPRLFERFHRVEGTRARTHEGSGIGLALVQELSRLHGGGITAESKYGIGTSFRVSIRTGTAHLPREKIGTSAERASLGASSAFVEEALRWLPDSPQRTAEETGAIKEAASVAPGASAPARVLVADDNADMREYLRRVLASHWTVDSVGDGRAALQAATEHPPDLILADVMMPMLDGFRLLKALREQRSTRDVPVIMLSARAGEEARVEGLQAGADDYLVKPFSAKELVARVRTHLELARLRASSDSERDRLRSLLREVPAVVNFFRGKELVFEFVHPRALEKYGGREVLGKPLVEALPEFETQEFPELLRRVVETGERLEGKEQLVKHDDGQGGLRESYWNYVYLPVRDRRGRVEGVMTFDLEVTDQVLARLRLDEQRQAAENARRAAESAVRVRDEFLSIASHELRTPLTTLGLQLDGLLESLAQPGAGSALPKLVNKAGRAREQADRLESLVGAMVDVFSLDRERLELSREEIDLGDAARRVIERLAPMSKRARAPIELSAERVMGLWDRRRVEQIIAELLSNALKFGAGKPVNVNVERGSDVARITITDRGIGIAEDQHARIFERFERGVSSSNYGGFGMGLWVVRELVATMHGTVRVESELGRGSTFVVELPRQP